MSTAPRPRCPKYRRPDASAYLLNTHNLSYSPQTLAKLAVIGGGPPMEYAGRFPLYPQDGLDAWAASKTSPRVTSTSELKAIRAAA